VLAAGGDNLLNLANGQSPSHDTRNYSLNSFRQQQSLHSKGFDVTRTFSLSLSLLLYSFAGQLSAEHGLFGLCQAARAGIHLDNKRKDENEPFQLPHAFQPS
jgi:hypothetical protein